MAIAKINGPMLSTNLLRYGVDLAIETDLLYVDTTNNRIGINTNAPVDQLHVIGGATVDTIGIASNTISSNITNADINVSPNGTGFLVTPRAKVSNLTASNIIYASTNGELVTDSGLAYSIGSGLDATLATLGNISFNANDITGSSNINITATGGEITVNSLAITDLNPTEIPYIGAVDNVLGDANLTWDDTTKSLDVVGQITVDTLTLDAASVSTSTGSLTLSSQAGETTVLSGVTAVRVPSGGIVQRPTVPVQADLRFNTSSLQLEYYDGTQWVVAGTDFQAISQDTFNGDDITTVFTLTETAGDAANLIISINGVVQQPGTAYSVAGTTLTFVTAPASGDTVDVRNVVRSYSFDKLENSTGTVKVETTATTVDFTVGGAPTVQIAADQTFDASNSKTVKLPQYTAVNAALITSPAAGDTIYVTDGDTGSPCLAVYDGTQWQKVLFAGAL